VFSYLRAGSAASRMRPGDLPLGLIRGAKYFHASGISQAISASACDTVFAAMEAARAAGTQVSFDTNLRLRLWPLARARAVIGTSIGLSDVLFISVEEGEQLCGTTEPDAILGWCHARGAKRVALKLGPQGAVGSDGSRRERVPGYAVKAVDATGAGDCFAGALLARMAAGEDFFQAIAYANAAAALTCTGFGAVAPLPRPAEVRALLSTRLST
jgi:2-dehydro-3-deoxygluconokinase